jgi:predicted nucleic-acid-binding protein
MGVDTNVLARYYVAEDDADAATERQRRAARDLIDSGQPLFLAKTVALELEWVLRGYYGFPVEQVLQVFDHLLAHPGLTAEDRPALEQAVAGVRRGLDSLMPCTMRAAAVVRQWRRLMIAALCGALASSIWRRACLCRQFPEPGSIQLQDASHHHFSSTPRLTPQLLRWNPRDRGTGEQRIAQLLEAAEVCLFDHGFIQVHAERSNNISTSNLREHITQELPVHRSCFSPMAISPFRLLSEI